MAKRLKNIVLQGFKTLNLNNPSLVPSDHWSDSQNMEIGRDGLWVNRKGIKSFTNAIGATNKFAHSIHFWKLGSGTRYFTVGAGTALYSYAEGTAYNNGTFTSRQTGFTDGSPFDFTQYKNTLLCTNGAESMYSSADNATFTQRNGANTVLAKYVTFANDTGYAAGIASAPSTFYYGSTVPANPYEFANTVVIEDTNGQDITGLTNLGPIIIATKNRSIYSVDIATPSRSQLDYGAGCVSHRGIVKAENSIYLPSNEGVFTLAQREGTTGSVAATPLSDPIDSLWKILVNKDEMVGIYNPETRSIYWAVETASQNYVLVYNVQYQGWSYFIGVNAYDFTYYEDSSGDFHLIYGDSGSDNIREMNHPSRDDDGAPINSILATGSVNFGTDEIKNCNHLEISGYGSQLMELEAEVYLDEASTPEITETIDKDNFVNQDTEWGGSLGTGSLGSQGLSGYVDSADDLEVKFWIKRIPVSRPFRTVQVKLKNSQAGVRWKYKSMTFNVEAETDDLSHSYIYN